MKSLKQMTEALISDSVETCTQNTQYLRGLVRDYFENMSDEEIRTVYETISADTVS